MIIEILFNKKTDSILYIYKYIYKRYIEMHLQGLAGWEEEGDHSVTKIPWSIFYIALFPYG